jgi:hypothetical protein
MDYYPPPTAMKSIRNMSRITYETTAFEGWHLSIKRKGTNFARYFSDRKYGGEKKANAFGTGPPGRMPDDAPH